MTPTQQTDSKQLDLEILEFSCRKFGISGVHFFPQPLVDGFSKLWLRGKGNLRVETPIPAGSMTVSCSAVLTLQKHQYLQGFLQSAQNLQKSCKNNNIYKVFCKNRSKTSNKLRFQQYLRGFLHKASKNIIIYKVFGKKRSNATIFTRFSAKSVQKHQYFQSFLQKACKNSNI